MKSVTLTWLSSVDITIAEKTWWKIKYKIGLLANTVVFITSRHRQMMKATVLAESSFLYFIFSLGSLHYGVVYRHESGKWWTLPFSLTFFISSISKCFNKCCEYSLTHVYSKSIFRHHWYYESIVWDCKHWHKQQGSLVADSS